MTDAKNISITWFATPYCKTIQRNVERIFFHLMRKHSKKYNTQQIL